MAKTAIPYSTTGYFTSAVIDYLNGEAALKPFYVYPPKLSSFPQIIRNRKKLPLHRDVLHNALIAQHKNFITSNLSGEVFKNIEQLKSSNTFTVVTAHQPNLFLGPLYLIYKIISTINLARQLNNENTEFHFVPVYWMGSEDHDKEELNHIHLFGKTFSWNTDQQGAFGRMKTDSLVSLIEEIKTVLGDSEDAKRGTGLLEDCYLKEQTIAEATRKILYHFFAGDGLVIVNGDDHALKELFIPVMERELLQQFSYPIVNESSVAFSKKYTSQITPREINLFYLDDGIRQRIVKEDDRWNVLNTTLSFSEAEIKVLLHTHPEKFSPNVVLRPVYQEAVLPNVAFIGGGAEVTYWMQLKEVFAAAGVALPMLLLRNSALWIDAGNASRMKKFNITTEDIFQPLEAIVNKFLKQQIGDAISLEGEKRQLNVLMDVVMQRTLQLDAGLKGAAEAEKVKMQKSLESLEDKLRKAAKKKEETGIQQLQTLKEKLFPGNSLQERYDNFLPYYLRYGDLFFVELKAHFNPMEQQFTILYEE